MMPMIITITLAQGARRMAKKRVLVKQLAAIEFWEPAHPLQRQDRDVDRG